MTSRIAALLLFFSFVVVGCSTNYDYQLQVKNETGRDWLIRVTGAGPDGETDVRRINYNAEGLALAWIGPRDKRIELLNDDCSVAGVFESSDGTTMAVPGVPGITGVIQEYQPDSRFGVPGIGITAECGGYMTL
jgi:hypothetical protein